MIAESIPDPVCPHPNEVDRKRIEKTLSDRERYKYVAPSVLPVDEGYLVRSPCCSRNVDPDGGIIDIARIEYQSGDFWRLYQRDDEKHVWRPHSESQIQKESFGDEYLLL